MTDTGVLFTPVMVGDLNLPNRVLMAPLTRNRAQSDGTPKVWRNSITTNALRLV